MVVTTRLARADERPLIEGLFQFYIHDFSELYPEATVGWKLDAYGRFGPYEHMDSYWRDADRRPYLIETDGRTAGFALVNAHSHRGEPLDHAMAEFFVVRQFRRSGVGHEAARSIFAANPGRWELAIAAANAGARAFWPRAVLGTPGVREFNAVIVQPNDRMVLGFTVSRHDDARPAGGPPPP
jgi:predicted acetyltransferase